MPKFVLKEIDAIKGSRHKIFKLEIDGKCQFDIFEANITEEKQYFSEFTTLTSYMQIYADGQRLPDKKLNVIHLNIKDVSAYEFKSKNLRIYFFYTSQDPGRIITLCGYKNQQKSDIAKFQSLIKRYLIENNNG